MRWLALLCEKLCLLKSTSAIQQQKQQQNMFISPHPEFLAQRRCTVNSLYLLHLCLTCHSEFHFGLLGDVVSSNVAIPLESYDTQLWPRTLLQWCRSNFRKQQTEMKMIKLLLEEMEMEGLQVNVHWSKWTILENNIENSALYKEIWIWQHLM